METPGRKTLIVAPPTPAGSKTLYYVEDHLGTVRVVTDETGTKAITEFHDYEPFGVEIPPSTNVAENTHQYTGQERDAATQMDYMHFRYYGSNLGRFMKPDNINGNLMNPQDWNLYSYVHGNPVNFNDPTGHEPPPPNGIADKKVSRWDRFKAWLKRSNAAIEEEWHNAEETLREIVPEVAKGSAKSHGFSESTSPGGSSLVGGMKTAAQAATPATQGTSIVVTARLKVELGAAMAGGDKNAGALYSELESRENAHENKYGLAMQSAKILKQHADTGK